MADLPRWIRTDRVESKAMWKAYKQTVQKNDPWYGKLTMRICASDDPPKSRPQVTMTPCAELDCYRCRHRLGGYTFKWYHNSWYQKYLDQAQKCDLWMVEDPDYDVPNYFGPSSVTDAGAVA